MSKTWGEVSSSPKFQQMPPEQQEAARDQYFNDVVAPQVPENQRQTVKSQFDMDTSRKEMSYDQKNKAGKKLLFDVMAEHTPLGKVEAGLNLATGSVASIPAGLAGLAQGAVNFLPGEHMLPGDRVNQVQSALTYEPISEKGKELVNKTTLPFQKLAEGADVAGRFTSEVTGSPLAGAAVNTAIQSLPAVVGKGIGRLKGGTGEAAEAGVSAEEKAKHYATNRAGLDWDALSDQFKKKLASIASDAKSLDRLDPKAVARQARLDALKLPATRGQVTRDLGQLTREENISKSDTGKPIRDITATQDEVLHGHLDTLRGETGATATTRQGVGKSVQGAEREKLNLLRSEKTAKYKAAKEAGATLEPVDIKPLNEWLENPTNRRNAPYLIKAIKDYTKGGKISINDLEEIRKEANANSVTPGPGKHFAGEAKSVIDGILDNAGSDIYKDARKSYRAMKDEFDRQGRVRKLVTEKGYSKDRAVALEDTFDHFIKGSAEDIKNIEKSLTEGGNEKTRAKGVQAWKDLQGATIDFLKEKASGKRAIVGENEQLQFNSSFREAFSELDKDGKIDAIFPKSQADMLRKIYDAVGDVRTKPAGRVAGSDTTPRIIAMLEKVANVPIAGDLVTGTVKAVQKLHSMGKETREVRSAVETPIDTASKSASRSYKKSQTLKELSESSRRAAPYTPLTLRGEDRQ